ncbi:hypothetical protein DPMN_152497 [Dreissena polymorpha]|uniref:Uncharacterized protein n=1 Tax=Dreissena polymorpha TaxID=45954 RepID=A0A9D4FGY0_DREPO|nr:hypothetical protein DPMN_152497 [Dreissena polymorpha]
MGGEPPSNFHWEFIENGDLTGSSVKPPMGDPPNLPREFNGNGSLAGAPVKTPRMKKIYKHFIFLFKYIFLTIMT